MNTDQLIPIIVALVSAGGLWTYLSKRAQHSFEAMKNDKDRSAEFQETLKEQVDRQAKKAEKLEGWLTQTQAQCDVLRRKSPLMSP